MNSNGRNSRQLHYTDLIERKPDKFSKRWHSPTSCTETNILVTRTLNTTRETQFWPSSISPDLNHPVEDEHIERTPVENARLNTYSSAIARNGPPWGSYMLRSGPQSAISHVQTELLRRVAGRGAGRGEGEKGRSNFHAR